MTNLLNSNRFKQLAGIIKENVQEAQPAITTEATWETGFDYDTETGQTKDQLYGEFSDRYKDENGFRPRHVNAKEVSVEWLKDAIDDLVERMYERRPELRDWENSGGMTAPAYDEEDKKEAYKLDLLSHGGQDPDWDKENAYNDALDSLNFDNQIDPKDLEDDPANASPPMSEPMGHRNRKETKW